MHPSPLVAEPQPAPPVSDPSCDRPTKPLKILTLDGGGIQAIATLLILDRLLAEIGRSNNKTPRPCDVFDTICGIGAGGWLAILLGRFQMDITACLTEWYNLTQSIMSRSRHKGYKRRLFQREHTYFEAERLRQEVDRLAELWGTGKLLYSQEDSEQSVRCRYVFVAARKDDYKPSKNVRHPKPTVQGDRTRHRDYELFRSYPCCPRNQKLRQGPRNPERFEIASAFCVTGAAKYFFAPWKEDMADNGRVSFLDRMFPQPHNITELALDEMWGLFGRDMPIDLVVNVGPGLPNQKDIRILARKFSWGRSNSGSSSTKSILSRTPSSRPEDEQLQASKRTTTFFSVAGRTIEDKLKRDEDQIELDICKKLGDAYQDQRTRYYRLAPDQSPLGTSMNDTLQSDLVVDKTRLFLTRESTTSLLSEASGVLGDGLQVER